VLGILCGDFECFTTIELWAEAVGITEAEVQRYFYNNQRVKEQKKNLNGGEEVPDPAPNANIAFRKMSQCSVLNEPIFQGLSSNL
jgi:hypothetical protein